MVEIKGPALVLWSSRLQAQDSGKTGPDDELRLYRAQISAFFFFIFLKNKNFKNICLF